MKALITGGAGFIGSHLAGRLLEKGWEVTVLDDMSRGKMENISSYTDRKKLHLIKGDIRDRSVCEEAAYKSDVIFHMAALTSVFQSMNSPSPYHDVNINGTLNVLEAARKNAVGKVIFSSSSSVYGDSTRSVQKESALPAPVSPYALTKLAGEYYMNIYRRRFGLETLSLRYFNVFGPRQHLDNEYAVVVPKFIVSLLNGENPPVYGDGFQSRDFTYVSNIVDANITAASRPAGNCGVLNIGSGEEHTVMELIDILNEINESDYDPEFLSERPGDIYRSLADITAARKHIGYIPKVDFYDGIKNTYDWFARETVEAVG